MKNLARKLILPLALVTAFGSFNPVYSGEPVKEKNKYEKLLEEAKILKLKNPIKKIYDVRENFYLGELQNVYEKGSVDKQNICDTEKFLNFYKKDFDRLNKGNYVVEVRDFSGDDKANIINGNEISLVK